MEVNTTPNTARGEVKITIAGQQYPVRFNLNVMRDWSKLTGQAATQFGMAIVLDHVEAFSGVIACAIRRYVPGHADYTQEQAVDLLEEMSQPEADAIAEALTEATTTVNPLLAAMNQSVAAKNLENVQLSAPAESGATSLTSDSASSN
ncbi:MAG: hypothetical protein ACRYFZ_15650 [Janthinobacterium lividum]